MKPLAVAALLCLALCACSQQPELEQPAALVQAGDDVTTPLPTPTGVGSVAVNPADFATQLATDDSSELAGVDFDSPDGNLHCGIFAPYYDVPGNSPFFGCAADTVDFDWPATGNDGSDDIVANAIVAEGAAPAHLTWTSGVIFAGQAPLDYPNVPRLENGTSLSWSTVTCEALDDTISCVSTDSGSGFSLSRSAYSVL
jgi:hypothetical protein